MYRYLALAAIVATVSLAEARDLAPIQAQSIELGSLRGVAYYTEAPNGYKVVTTLADGEAGLPVRFEAVLLDQQSVTISVPGKPGEQDQTVEISRIANKLVVATVSSRGNKAAAIAPQSSNN